MLRASAVAHIRQHTSAYVSIRQHTSAYAHLSDVGLDRRKMLRDGGIARARTHLSHIRQHPSAYVSIRQHPSASVSIRGIAALEGGGTHATHSLENRGDTDEREEEVRPHGREHVEEQRDVVDQVREQPPPVTYTSAYVSICQHTSACVSIRQHTSAYVCIRQHTSADVSIRQQMSAYVSIREICASMSCGGGMTRH
jgi:hypothetical protein